MDQNIPTQSTRPEKARLRRLNVRLSQQEWDKVHKLAANSTCRSTSDYARKVLSQKPVKVFYRNQSFDEFEEQMIQLLPQLDTANANFEEAVKKLSAIDNFADAKNTYYLLQTYGNMLVTKVNEIKKHIENLSEKCDPK